MMDTQLRGLCTQLVITVKYYLFQMWYERLCNIILRVELLSDFEDLQDADRVKPTRPPRLQPSAQLLTGGARNSPTSSGAKAKSWFVRRAPPGTLGAMPLRTRNAAAPADGSANTYSEYWQGLEDILDRETLFGSLLGELRVYAPCHALVEALRIPHPRAEAVRTVRGVNLPGWR
jgi:hypothetical protein